MNWSFGMKPRSDEARDAINDAKRSSPDRDSSDSIFKRPRLENCNSTLPTFKVSPGKNPIKESSV